MLDFTNLSEKVPVMKKILKLVLITITVCAMTLSAEITTVEGIEWSYTVTAEGAVVELHHIQPP